MASRPPISLPSTLRRASTPWRAVQRLTKVVLVLVVAMLALSSPAAADETNPATAPTATAELGKGLGLGGYHYVYTFVTASGETRPSAAGAITIAGPLAPPTTIGAAAPHCCRYGVLTAGLNFSYVYTFYSPSTGGETTPSPVATMHSTWAANALVRAQVQAAPSGTERRFYRTAGYTGSPGPFRLMPGDSDGFADDTADHYIDLTLTDDLSTTTAPTQNTLFKSRARISSIGAGPAGVTARRLYRTTANGSELKLVATIADNTTTTYLDERPDGDLGALAPSNDTSGLGAPVPAANGASCTTPAQCASGHCADGLCCDTACAGACDQCNVAGSVGTCRPSAATTVCRAAAGACDIEEKCDGTSTACPADAFVAAGGGAGTNESPTSHVPRPELAADGAYELGMQFTPAVSGAITELRVLAPAGAIHPVRLWNANTGQQLVSTVVTGKGMWAWAIAPVNVPVDAGASYVVSYFTAEAPHYYFGWSCPIGHVVGNIRLDACTYGYENTLPPYEWTGLFAVDATLTSGQRANATVCRSSTASCDPAEYCDGGSAWCPVDATACSGGGSPDGASCTSAQSCNSGFCAGGVCCNSACTDGCASCNVPGTVGTCRPSLASTVCRQAAGVCDVEERCNGSSTACPADHFASGGTCRPSTGACDLAEACDGNGPACPADALVASGTVCDASEGVCNPPDRCSGSSGVCMPANPAGLPCDDGNICTVDACNASGACVGQTPQCPSGTTFMCAGGTLWCSRTGPATDSNESCR